MAWKGAEDGIEYALFHSVLAFQALYHFPVGMRIFKVHVEGRRIGGAGPGQTSFTAPLVPHSPCSKSPKSTWLFLPKALGWSQLIPGYLVMAWRIRARRWANFLGNIIDFRS
jgi:hypothetical protein